MQLCEMTLECDALCEKLVACQAKFLRLEQDVAFQQHALQEALVRAIKAEKKCLNFVEDIEQYHQMLINTKE